MADGNFDNVSATGNIVADGYISAVGNVTAARFLFTSPTTANISAGNLALYSNLNMTGAVSASGNVLAAAFIGNLVTANQPNITNVGTLTSLTVSGNATSGNVLTAGIISSTGNATHSNVTTGIVSANAVLANAITFNSPTTANIAVGNLALYSNLNMTGAVSTSGNITGVRLIGNLVTANQPNITNIGTLTSLAVNGNSNFGNILTIGFISSTGNATFGNIGTVGRVSASNVLANTIEFNSPTTANISAGNLALYSNLNMTGSISAGGNIKGNYILGNGYYLSGISGSGGNANTGNVTFDGTTLSGPSGSDDNYSIYIKPSADFTNALQILPTADNDIHLFEASGNAITLGAYGESQVSVNGPNSANANITVQSNGNTWTFGEDGGTIFPNLNVQRGDNQSGTISGQTLLFGSANSEAIISTPDGVAGNEYSQRLVINPGAGNNYGEGGDIYLWAGRGGDGSGSGGDIKIRGGQGGANTVGGSGGAGGYIRMEAGDAASTGGSAGYIDITGGYSNTTGGYVNVTGGTGDTDGGDVKIYGGYGQSVGGNVNIWGGASGSGQANEGNVNIQTGGNTWTFSTNGQTYLPDNTIMGAIEGANTFGFYNNNANTQFLIELGSTNAWDFNGASGNLTVPGNLNAVTASPAPSINGFDSVNAVTFSASGNITANNISIATIIPSGNTFVVKPVRGDSTGNLVADGFLAVYYNPTTGEFAYASS